jgi:O-antigen/teichoic acid export membrane protein
VINIFFIESFGLIIAAISTTISYFILALIHFFLCRRIFSEIKLSIKPFFLSFLVALFLIIISLLYPPSHDLNTLTLIYFIFLLFMLLKIKIWEKFYRFF